MSKTFYYDWEWELDASPADLWPLVSDTDRFNADTGLAPLQTVDMVDGERERRMIIYQFGLVPLVWQEEPFEWIYQRRFGVIRRYDGSPIKEMRVLVELTPLDDGRRTHLRYQVWANPNGPLGWIAIPLVIGVKSRLDFGRVFKQYARLVQKDLPSMALSQPAVQLAPGGDARLREGRQQLIRGGFDEALVDRLLTLIREADDLSVRDIRPYEQARYWHRPRRQVLELFLEATRVGLLDFEWQILCPHCRGAGENRFETLSDLSRNAHCDSCRIDYDVNFEQGVELVFRPNAAVRQVEPFDYCVGGPQTTPHIVAQQVLEAEETRSLQLGLEPGRYRLRVAEQSGNHIIRIVENGGDAEAAFKTGRSDWPQGETHLSPRPEIHLYNNLNGRRQIILERTAWTDDAATAAEVTMIQRFRDLFTSEALRPDVQFSVGRVAILFTDLVDSTRLYNEVGDAPAFGMVLNHFDILKTAVDDQQGAIVKTIGDAIMAAFPEPLSALKAIHQAQIELQEEAEREGVRPLLLKGSVHMGPCITVTLNERLDYFGSTVNIAARLEGFAEANVVVVSDAIYADETVAAYAQEMGADLEAKSFQGQLKGFEQEAFTLWRTRLARLPAVAPKKDADKGKVQEL